MSAPVRSGMGSGATSTVTATCLVLLAAFGLDRGTASAQHVPSTPTGLRFEAGATLVPERAWARPRAIPGTIQAEDFDSGPNGVAYSDTSGGNTGGAYRSTDVDIQACTEGGYNVGWVEAGEWLNYTVIVAEEGTYYLDFRVASALGGTLHAEFNGQDKTGPVQVPVTGGWQTWTTIRRTVTLSSGSQVMRVVFDTGRVNLQAMLASAAPAVASPFGGTARDLPGTVQMEDFDLGGAGVAYRDTSAGNAGGAYRTTDVDIASLSTGGYTVGWTRAGEWLRYTVNVSASGSYRLVARVASAGTGGTFHVEFDGVDRTGSLRVPDTGGWTTYQDMAATVSLTAGVQSMRLVLDSDGSSGAVGNFSFIRIEVPVAEPPPPPPPAGGTLRVATWNISFGGGDMWGQAREIVRSGADVVLLQEVSTHDEDMPTTYPDRLRQLTGQVWHSVWAPHGGRYGWNEGTLILSRLPLVDRTTMNAYERGFSRVLVSVGGVGVQLFSVHLDWYDTALRTSQLEAFLSWSRGFSGPRIAGGDFNSWWGEWWIQRVESEYTDTWQDVTGSDENGYTLNGAVRFDYLFRSHEQSTRLTPTACWVQSTGVSDHALVVADYRVR